MELSIADGTDSQDRYVLTLTGSLDLASRDQLLDAAAPALAKSDSPGLVLDLSEVTFFDSSGIGALVKLAGDAEDAGVRFALKRPSDRVLRVLRIAGLTDAWPIEDAPEPGSAGS